MLIVYKFVCFSLLLFTISFFSFANQKQHVTIYGESTYRPYAWVEDGVFKGIYIDVLNTIFEQMDDYQVTLKAVPWERGLFLLKTGDAFSLFPPYYYPNRRPYISPYSTPLYREKTVLICQKKVFDIERNKWPNDYYGLSIGQSSGYLLGGEAFFEAVARNEMFLSESRRAGQNLLMVATGRIDCYINDELVIKTELNELSKDEHYRAYLDNVQFGPIISYEDSFLGFSNVNNELYPYKAHFVEQFNTLLTEMHKRGEIELIIEKHLSEW
ncbi:ABC transporter substrate-binding protein [Vibrio sp. MACH09]|uniref:substrate-binding periplasmic protein n=1 Tax=Vibrio sp. MACH09 TaxID=3025122 RepID=UPI002794777F|nr:ABC transporter substrate-binding protein [Vibrio sp. MACH09]GLO61978.1 ABC transporter substrate-binding protein [Vibrio sp. MACH09]